MYTLFIVYFKQFWNSEDKSKDPKIDMMYKLIWSWEKVCKWRFFKFDKCNAFYAPPPKKKKKKKKKKKNKKKKTLRNKKKKIGEYLEI